MSMLDEVDLTSWFNSEEGQKSAKEFMEKIQKEEDVLNFQLDRFHEKYKETFSDIVDQIIAKYESDKYKDLWWKRGCEPPVDLYWFLLDYAKKYGRDCSDEEWKEYGNMFCSSLYYIDGYYLTRMDGQGSVVQIKKQNNKMEENKEQTSDETAGKVSLSDAGANCLWKPTNQIRWYTKHYNTYPKQKLQQMWISESGETKWENVPEESGE